MEAQPPRRKRRKRPRSCSLKPSRTYPLALPAVTKATPQQNGLSVEPLALSVCDRGIPPEGLRLLRQEAAIKRRRKPDSLSWFEQLYPAQSLPLHQWPSDDCAVRPCRRPRTS